MKTKIQILIFTVFTFLVFSNTVPVSAQSSIAERLSGRIVLQVQQNGEAWYIAPGDNRRHYLGRPADAFKIMREKGLGISNTDLGDIPKEGESWNARADVLNRTKGKILLQVEEHGEAWYVNPVNGKRYYLGRPADAFRIMRNLGLGITKQDLKKIEFGSGPLEKASIPVPFVAQAPTGDWSLPYGEACEETSIIMIDAYYKGQRTIDRFAAQDRIQELVSYQNERFGFYDDTSMSDTAIMAKEQFGYDGFVEKEVTKEKIKEYIVKKMPVIFPVAGRNLGNPHYIGEGPPYHVMVIVGFDDDQFLVHDPGTRYGAYYRYHMDHLLRENHDLTVDQYDIKNGERGMLVLKP